MSSTKDRDPEIILRRPSPEDGVAINDLVEKCKPLDENSVYCNLLQCSHFSETCSLAEIDGEVVGFVSGYMIPEDEESLFVWQVAVSPDARGLSLGKRMIFDILHRSSAKKEKYIKTTITPDNKASHGVFKSIAREMGADVDRDVLFDEEEHFDGQQNTEMLWNIGPFKRADIMSALSSAA